MVEVLGPDKDKVMITLWLAKDAGMLPVKYTYFGRNGNLLERMEVLEVAQNDGFWYPKKAKRTQCFRWVEQKSVTHEITVTKCIANPTYGPDEFKAEIAPGTIVYDDRVKENYLMGSPDK